MAVGAVVGALGEVTPTAAATEAGTWLTEVISEDGAGVMVSTSEVPVPWFSWWRITTRAASRMTAITMSPRAA